MSFTVRNAWNPIFLNPFKPPLLSDRTAPLHLNTHFIPPPPSVPLEAILVTTCSESTFWQIWNSNKAAAAVAKRGRANGNLLKILKLSLRKHSTWHTGIHFTLAVGTAGVELLFHPSPPLLAPAVPDWHSRFSQTPTVCLKKQTNKQTTKKNEHLLEVNACGQE